MFDIIPPCSLSEGTFEDAGASRRLGASTPTSPGVAPGAARLRTAAIVYGPEDDVDAALAFCVDTLCRAGFAIGGLLQRFGERVAAGKREMLVRVLPGNETIRLNDPRGPGVQGCILDTDALARAATAFRRASLARPDLLVASRFGKEEATGGGMRAELAEALISGVPLLIPVRIALLPAWRAFLGEPADELPPQTNVILSWAGLAGRGQSSWTEYCAIAPISC